MKYQASIHRNAQVFKAWTEAGKDTKGAINLLNQRGIRPARSKEWGLQNVYDAVYRYRRHMSQQRLTPRHQKIAATPVSSQSERLALISLVVGLNGADESQKLEIIRSIVGGGK